MAWNASHEIAVNYYKIVKPGKYCVLKIFRLKAIGHKSLAQNLCDNTPKSHTTMPLQSRLNMVFRNMGQVGGMSNAVHDNTVQRSKKPFSKGQPWAYFSLWVVVCSLKKNKNKLLEEFIRNQLQKHRAYWR